MISFIIPTYNRPDLITQTLNSLLKNDDEKWEAICVDDGSEEETIDILKAYSEKYNCIKFNQRRCLPKGAPHCRNIGAQMAIGEYLIFLDSDDIAAPWSVGEYIKIVNKYPNFDIWAFSLLLFKEKPGDSSILWELDFIKCENDLDKILLKNNPWSGSALLWRKNVFLSVGGWNLDIVCWQDWELHLRAIISKFKIKEVYWGRPQLFIRRNNSSQIVNDANFTETLLSRKYLFKRAYSLLADRQLNTKKNSLALSGYVFIDALRIISNGLNTSYLDFYNVIKDFKISKHNYYRGLIYLKWRSFVKKKKIKNKLTEFVWPVIVPSYFSAKRKYKVLKIKPEFLVQIKQLKY